MTAIQPLPMPGMKTPPMLHQITGLDLMRGKRNFALLMEQGTGKTWTTLADAVRCYQGGKINAVAVVAPNGVHTNWVRREIPAHVDVPTLCYYWKGTPSSKKAKKALEDFLSAETTALKVFAINIEAVNFNHGYEALERFLEDHQVMFVLDEATRIKNMTSKRTKKIHTLAPLATCRRALTGTPITKSPIDLYAQFHFLKPGLLGTTSYRAFVAEYSVLLDPSSPQMQAIIRKTGGRGVPQVVRTDEHGNKMWQNLDALSAMIKPHSFRVTKEECLDLPPKIRKTVFFQLTAKQRAAYDRLQEDLAYSHNENDNSFEAIAARTKLKQMTSGFIKIDGDEVSVDGEYPRLDAFKEYIEEIDEQFICWAMYEPEIEQLMAHLDERDITYATYYGKTSREDREKAIDDFQAGRVQAFIGHAQAAGIGLTLTAAALTFYFSCSYDNELRMQSEDRNHRIGSERHKHITYVDFVAEDTIDEDVAKSLAVKTHLANKIIDGKA